MTGIFMKGGAAGLTAPRTPALGGTRLILPALD